MSLWRSAQEADTQATFLSLVEDGLDQIAAGQSRPWSPCQLARSTYKRRTVQESQPPCVTSHGQVEHGCAFESSSRSARTEMMDVVEIDRHHAEDLAIRVLGVIHDQAERIVDIEQVRRRPR
ncbi:hypothetical protein GCM10022236_40750 [Microlunatus ginsengisoli]|uniref:Uncharacterized protein n=1 Tax=Microlunatus ginsengisoli TaxID=363863 RepID=A0ABP7AJV9_9ACTN